MQRRVMERKGEGKERKGGEEREKKRGEGKRKKGKERAPVDSTCQYTHTPQYGLQLPTCMTINQLHTSNVLKLHLTYITSFVEVESGPRFLHKQYHSSQT